jgi:hypothetical protein
MAVSFLHLHRRFDYHHQQSTRTTLPDGIRGFTAGRLSRAPADAAIFVTLIRTASPFTIPVTPNSAASESAKAERGEEQANTLRTAHADGAKADIHDSSFAKNHPTGKAGRPRICSHALKCRLKMETSNARRSFCFSDYWHSGKRLTPERKC